LLSLEQLISKGLRFADEGATHFSVVTSGTALNEAEIDTVCRVSEYLRKNSNLRLCASLGMLSEINARKLKSAGISRYHHNLETARSFFDQICTTHKFDDDIETIQNAKTAGLEVCSGGILGMGESWEQRVELALTLRDLDVDSVPINFLNPIQGTRFEGATSLPPMDALASIAIFRFIHPRKDITICGGRESTLKDFQSWIFLAGANGIMVGNYLTTQGRDIQMDHDMIAQMGFGDWQM
jgi:biotin synthase